MNIVIFGLTISSSWGNGHATLWRGLVRALTARGARVTFFERDAPYYARARDMHEIEGGELHLYDDWTEVRAQATRSLRDADVAIVTSYCPDALAAGELVHQTRAIQIFYDLDSPVTLARLRRGESVEYVGPRGYRDFDLVLSYAGGPTLEALRRVCGARRVAPLYGHVDPAAYAPAQWDDRYRGDLSYIGAYAADRQDKLDAFFLAPARRLADRRFVLAGSQYPADFAWSDNVYFLRHLVPAQHPQFYASSRLTLNVTRRDMADAGWAPSGRLFEAACCEACLISDSWPGLETFFEVDEEILVARDTGDVVAALARDDNKLRRIGEAARARVLAHHTSQARAAEFEAHVAGARSAVPVN